MGFEFSPVLWFVCRLCKEPFADTEVLKKHKLEHHLGECQRIKCIIFQETLLEHPWIPPEDEGDDGDCNTYYELLRNPEKDSLNSPTSVGSRTYQNRRKRRPNPCVLISRLRSSDLSANKTRTRIRAKYRVKNQLRRSTRIKSIADRCSSVEAKQQTDSSISISMPVLKPVRLPNRNRVQDNFKIREEFIKSIKSSTRRNKTASGNRPSMSFSSISRSSTVLSPLPPVLEPETPIDSRYDQTRSLSEPVSLPVLHREYSPEILATSNDRVANKQTGTDLHWNNSLLPLADKYKRIRLSSALPLQNKSQFLQPPTINDLFKAVNEKSGSRSQSPGFKGGEVLLRQQTNMGSIAASVTNTNHKDKESPNCINNSMNLTVSASVATKEINLTTDTEKEQQQISSASQKNQTSKQDLNIFSNGASEEVVVNVTSIDIESTINNIDANLEKTDIPQNLLALLNIPQDLLPVLEPDEIKTEFDLESPEIETITMEQENSDSSESGIEIVACVTPLKLPLPASHTVSPIHDESDFEVRNNIDVKVNRVIPVSLIPATIPLTSLFNNVIDQNSSMNTITLSQSPYNIRRKKSVINYTESQACRHCNKDFYTVEDVEDHEKLCVLRKNMDKIKAEKRQTLPIPKPTPKPNPTSVLNFITSEISSPLPPPAFNHTPPREINTDDEGEGIQVIGIKALSTKENEVRNSDSDSDFEPKLSRTRSRTRIRRSSTRSKSVRKQTTLPTTSKPISILTPIKSSTPSSTPNNRGRGRPRKVLSQNSDLDPALPLHQWLERKKVLDPSNIILLVPDPSIPLAVTSEGSIMLTIDSGNPIQCRLCNTKLHSEEKVKKHVESCWFSNKTKHCYCTMCNKSFSNAWHLRRHNVAQHCEGARPRFKCAFCSKDFYDTWYCKKHESTHKDKSSKSHSPDIAKTPRNKASNSNPPKVPGSPKPRAKSTPKPPRSLITKVSRSRALLTLQSSKLSLPFSPQLGKPKELDITLDIDEKERRRQKSKTCKFFECRSCDASFFTKRNLADHEIASHSKSNSDPRCIDIVSDFNGGSKSLPSKHQKRKSVAVSVPIPSESTIKAIGKQYLQENSLFVFDGQTKKNKPMKAKSGSFIANANVGDKELKCQVCTRSFSKNKYLQDHLKVHTGEKPFKCNIGNCTLSFSRKSTLRFHTQLKHWQELGLKSHSCPISTCDKAFGVPSHLKYHMTRYHSNSEV